MWDVLEDVIKEHPVLLNRAPTLHRLGIQAFEPVLVEGKALQIHPLVCTAFNADFDGDQMAIHVPLSAEAQAEARVLMLSANNILSPASGRPIVTPTQDLVIGAYYLTENTAGAKGEGRVFRHTWEAARPTTRVTSTCTPRSRCAPRRSSPARSRATTASSGRSTPDDARPAAVRGGPPGRLHRPLRPLQRGRQEAGDGRHRGAPLRQLPEGADRLVARRDQEPLLPVRVAVGPDGVDRRRQDAGSKRSILDGYEAQADKVENQFRRGIITDGERRQQEVRIWTDATADVQKAMEDEFKAQKFNPIDMMVGSGARGNMTQMRQIAGMRGLVANPRGDMIPRPIKKNFREGLETLEYFIATPGARKGLVDTALRTADSGLPDASSRRRRPGADRREEDCGTTLGVWVENVEPDSANRRTYLETKLFGRALLNDTTLSPMADGRTC